MKTNLTLKACVTGKNISIVQRVSRNAAFWRMEDVNLGLFCRSFCANGYFNVYVLVEFFFLCVYVFSFLCFCL